MHTRTNTTTTTLRQDSDDKARLPCLDCLFWYRCKPGKIDCEYKRL